MTRKEPKLTNAQIVALERLFNQFPWLLNHLLEPVIGHPACPKEVENHGIRGASIFTAFVAVNEENETYGCRFEACHAFNAPSLDLAVRHQRSWHFDHKPFQCAQW